MESTFDDVLSQAPQGLDPALDIGRITIHHKGLTNPINVPLRSLKNLTRKGVMEHLQNVLTSHENLSLDYNFYLNVGTIKVLKGGTGARPINRLNGENDSTETKKSFIICGLFAQSKFCHTCLKPYQKRHSCASTCMVMTRKLHCKIKHLLQE